MSDNGIKPTENADTRFVTIRAKTWRALLEIAGRQIDPESAEVHWRFRQTHTESTPISRPGAIASDVAFSPGLLGP
jgi:hypothetical protein